MYINHSLSTTMHSSCLIPLALFCFICFNLNNLPCTYTYAVMCAYFMYTQSQITSGLKTGVWKISTAETKIIVVLCYYALFGIVALSFFSLETAQQDDQIMAVQQYFVCEAAGSGVECDRSGFDRFEIHGLVVLVYILLGLIPAVNLTFVINWTVAKDSLKRIWKKYSLSIFSTQTTFVSGKQTSSVNETGV